MCKDNHLFLLYSLVSDFSINFEKKIFLIRTILSFLFFIPYKRGVARADFLLGAVSQWGIIMTFGIEITISDFQKLLKYLIYILF